VERDCVDTWGEGISEAVSQWYRCFADGVIGKEIDGRTGEEEIDLFRGQQEAPDDRTPG
jgi:hypothetical protein